MLTKKKPAKQKCQLKQAVAKVMKLLHSSSPQVRIDTIQRLKAFALPEVMTLIVSRLQKQLKSRSADVSLTARENLLLLGPRGFCPDLFQSRSAGLAVIMQQGQVEQRLQTLRYIADLITQAGLQPSTRLVDELKPALCVALEDESEEVRRAAARIIRSLGRGGETLIVELQRQLKDRGEDLPLDMVLARVVLGSRLVESEPQHE